MTGPGRSDCFAQLCETVEDLGRLRDLLGEVAALAGAAPDLTDTELRDRLLGLGCRALHATRGPGSPGPDGD